MLLLMTFYFQFTPFGLLTPCIRAAAVNLEFVRHRGNKHWDPKFKWLRAKKVMSKLIHKIQLIGDIIVLIVYKSLHSLGA
jgi:hypothetical protein